MITSFMSPYLPTSRLLSTRIAGSLWNAPSIRKQDRSFGSTLIELLVVIAIIAIVVAILLALEFALIELLVVIAIIAAAAERCAASVATIH